MKEQPKFYKNKLRQLPEQPQERYVPNYQLLGIDPEDYSSIQVKDSQETKGNPRPFPVKVHRYVNQPYAEVVESPIGPGSVPNVGNNMEHTWSSVDGEIIDDLPTNPNATNVLIDNNDYVTESALKEPSFGDNVRNRSPFIQQALSHINLPKDNEQLSTEPIYFPPLNEPESIADHSAEKPSVDDLLSVVSDLETENYLLIVGGVPICSGPLKEIEEETSELVLGNHEFFEGKPIPEEDIIVLKKIKIKVGVFLG